jgi:hypothetical protein
MTGAVTIYHRCGTVGRDGLDANSGAVGQSVAAIWRGALRARR